MMDFKLILSLIMVSFGLLGCATATEGQAAHTNTVQQGLAQVAPEQKYIPAYNAPHAPAQARQAVADAYEAFEKKSWQRIAELAPIAVADPVLGMYPRYWLLRHDLQNRAKPVPTAAVKQFLHDYPDTYLADAVRSLWITASVRQGDYAGALQIKSPRDPWSSVQCSLLLARQVQGQPVNSTEVIAAFANNNDCYSMIDQMAKDKVLSSSDLNTLLRNTLELNQLAPAARIAAALFDNKAMVQYAALIKNPHTWLKKQGRPQNTTDYQLYSIAMARMARGNDRLAAVKYIQDTWQQHMPAADMHWVWGQYGLVAALNTASDAARWYRLSGDIRKTDYNHAWEARAELRAQPIKWSKLAAAIQKMSPRQADEPVWRYWYGRAMAATGKSDLAQQYFNSIATDLSFYGQLAAEELGAPQQLPQRPQAVAAEAVIQAQSNPSLQRALELFKIGARSYAVGEWNYGLHGMDDMQLRGAAQLALSQDVYDRVVNTSLLTKQVVDMEQRFLAPFESRVEEKANLINLDVAWVYGLIRQESRFITDARSRVGASGLMQLMPATAKWVAKKIGMTDFHPSAVNDFDTNTILGTSYMDMVLQGLDGSQLLASAGYNAGPGRAKKWRANLPGEVEGAIFAETIPFTETRLYVKNVLSNSVYYANLFTGKLHSLKDRLGVVSPTSVTRTARQ